MVFPTRVPFREEHVFSRDFKHNLDVPLTQKKMIDFVKVGTVYPTATATMQKFNDFLFSKLLRT